jgi:chromosomal replication initiation ATPase DnaA
MLAALEKAKEIRSRLINPVNGRYSTELDIVTEPVLRSRRIEIATRRDRERRRLETTQRVKAAVIDAIYNDAHKENIERKRGYRSVESIMKIVCLHFGVSRIDVLSDRRTADIVRPRQIAMYLAKRLTLRSLPEIGRRFGGRDHTTVLHAVRKTQSLLDSGHPGITADIAQLREMIGE